jgi:hypothetical protein
MTDAELATWRVEVKGRVLEVLTTYEVGLLARYLSDGESQAEIAAADGVAQTTASFRIRAALKRLAAAGIVVPVPVRTRPAQYCGRMVYIEPKSLDRLVRDDADPGEPSAFVRARWPDAKKLDLSDDAGGAVRRSRS